MKIYYDMAQQSRVDSSGTRTNSTINLRYKEKPTWEIVVVADGSSVNLAGAASWRAAVDKDYSSATEPMCRSVGASIDASRAALGIISVTIDANTVSFFSAVDGKNTPQNAYFELWGLDKTGTPIYYVAFRIAVSGVIDPDGGDIPKPVPNGLCSITEIEAALAGKFPLLNRLTVNDDGKLCLDGIPVASGSANGSDEPATPPQEKRMYYGYIPYETAGDIQSVTAVTADMLECSSMISAEPGPLDKTSIGTVPAGAWIVVLLPADSGLTAAKYNGINGQTTFEPDNGIAGSGANGSTVTINSTEYLVYGEFCLNDGEFFIYVNKA